MHCSIFESQDPLGLDLCFMLMINTSFCHVHSTTYIEHVVKCLFPNCGQAADALFQGLFVCSYPADKTQTYLDCSVLPKVTIQCVSKSSYK